ncbi:MAG: hypothetical protein J6Y94_05145 [Bacteriovoracaceae bacterium]|nr:hypothetical protein [Bacteriovoracaceae bacterium]
MLLDRDQVLQILPHRDPFLFIDTVESIMVKDRPLVLGEPIDPKQMPEVSITAAYHTRADHPIFAGHFPGNPILPGVVQIEMMAQASAFGMVAQLKDPFAKKLGLAFMGVSDVKFRKPIYPEMDLVIKTKCLRERGTILVYEAQIWHQDAIMSQVGNILAAVTL